VEDILLLSGEIMRKESVLAKGGEIRCGISREAMY